MMRTRPFAAKRHGTRFFQRANRTAKRVLVAAAAGALLLGGAKALAGAKKPIAKPQVQQVQRLQEAKPKQATVALEKRIAQAAVRFPIASEKTSILLSPNEPRLPTSLIDAELKARNSPAVGFGAAFVKWANYYGVKPEIALTFFRMESGFGTKGLAVQTKAIGNIRYTPPAPNSEIQYTNYNGFRCYDSWEGGIRDFFRLLASKKYAGGKRKTLEQIIPRYAPARDKNDVQAYKKFVVNYLNDLYKKANAQQ